MEIPSYLVNEHFDDRYFDVVNALDEAQQIYFNNNNLMARIAGSIQSKTPFTIGETGFGAGRIVVSLLEYLQKSQLKDVTIEYNTVELYPMGPEKMEAILGSFRDRVGASVDAVLEAYGGIDITVPGWHSMRIGRSFGAITINLWIGEALEMVHALEKPCDVWFLDGHGPKKNPSIWRPELLMEIGKKTKPGGSCSTFTVASSVIRALTEAGFSIDKLPGCGGKKHVLLGIKT